MQKDNNSDNSTIISPYSTNQLPQNSSNNRKKLIIISVAALIMIAVLTTILVLSLSNRESEGYLEDVREDTPTLQLFAKLDQEIPMGEIDSVVHSIEPSAEVIKEDDGTGSIRIPDSKDYILFDYYLDEEGELEDADEEFIRIVDVASGIRYVYPTAEDAYNLITYSDDEQTYLVFVQGSGFEFDTKEEAVKNYLNPEVKQK